MTSRYAIPAAVAVLASGLAFSPANAADLGGDCCADLEERVAELEATTVRKGNRKVSLKVSGFVSKSVMIWDDGEESNAYVVDTNGGTLDTNITFSGDAKIAPGWSSGFQITIEYPGGADATGTTADDDDGVNGGGTLVSSLWIKSDTYGKVSLGKQSQASDNAALLPDLSGTIIQANYVTAFQGGSFAARPNGAAGAVAPTWLAFTPCATAGVGIASDCNGGVLHNVRYDTPTIAGFTVSTSWGEDDFWDVAVAYAGQFGDVKVKAAYAFSNMRDEGYSAGSGNNGFKIDVDFHQVGASALHVPTGLFIYAAYVTEDVDSARTGAASATGGSPSYTDAAYYVKAGIRQKWNALGETIFYGEYHNVESKTFQTAGAGTPDTDLAEFEQYGAGVVQYIDAAAMQLHLTYQHKEVDVSAAGIAAGSGLAAGGYQDLDILMVGATIFF